MKPILITLFLLSSLMAQAQQETRNFGIIEVFRGGDSLFIKKLITNTVIVYDGLITKSRTPPDTASLYISQDGSIYEGTTVWKKFNVVTPTPVTEKVDGDRATFAGSWTRTANNPGWFMNTIAFSNITGSTASYTFTGTKIELWAERLVSHGNGSVKIDTGQEIQVSFNASPLGLPVKIYESATLPLGTHTITLKVLTGYSLLDYFIIHK